MKDGDSPSLTTNLAFVQWDTTLHLFLFPFGTMVIGPSVLTRVFVAVSRAGTIYLNQAQDTPTEGGSERVFPCPVFGAKSRVTVSHEQPREFMEYLAHVGRERR